MDDFQKQIDEQVKIYQMQLDDKLKRLDYLMRRLDIHSEEKLESTLEFAALFNQLKKDGIISQLRDNTP